ncbi:MAG: hypothetical protein RQ899_10510, partial [Pseudomonadales bacterium]|nr:hypothetical protein [Pseudomonadales bacterium]
MLNELYSMQRGLEKIGEIPTVTHNDITPPGMGTTIRVLLKPDGSVERIEWMDKEKIKDTWSLGNGNKNQFPAIKLTFPLIPDVHNRYTEWKKKNKNPKDEDYRKFIHEQVEKYDMNIKEIADTTPDSDETIAVKKYGIN